MAALHEIERQETPDVTISFTTRASILYTFDHIVGPRVLFTKEKSGKLDFPARTHRGIFSSGIIAAELTTHFIHGDYTQPAVLLGAVQRIDENKHGQITDSRSDIISFKTHIGSEDFIVPPNYILLSEAAILSDGNEADPRFVHPEIKQAALRHFSLHRMMLVDYRSYKKFKPFDKLILSTEFDQISANQIAYKNNHPWKG